MSYVDIDSNLQQKQEEWGDLLAANEFSSQDIPSSNELNLDSKVIVAVRWYEDGVMGRKIDFPQTKAQVTCYMIASSDVLLYVFSVACFVQMAVPFFREPYCPWRFINDLKTPSSSEGYINRDEMNVIDLCCLLIYLFDMAMYLSVNYKFKVRIVFGRYDRWSFIRLLCIALLCIDSIIAFANFRILTVSRSLIPIIYISRRKSLRQMVQGLIVSAKKCINIFMLLVACVLLWGFVGYLLFRHVTVEDSRFNTIPKSLLTALHSFASRSFALFALNPYFVIDKTIALYYISLTIAADIICTSLIVAVGTREYKSFASKRFHRHLRNRRRALLAIFNTLCVASATNTSNTEVITRHVWLRFCAAFNNSRFDSSIANLLFSLECDHQNRINGTTTVTNEVGASGFFRLCALLDSHIDATTDATAVAAPNNRAFASKDTIAAAAGVTSSTTLNSIHQQLTAGVAEEAKPENASSSSPAEAAPSLFASTAKSIPFPVFMQQFSLLDSCRVISNRIRVFVIDLILLSVPLSNDYHLFPFSAFFTLCRILLALQLVMVSSYHDNSDDSDHDAWIAFGYVLEVMFWIEMICLMIAWNIKNFFFSTGYGYIAVTNVIALALLIHHNTTPYHSALYLIQSVRLLRLFRYLRDWDLFMSITPLVLRVLFLIFASIYFFAVLAYNRFCDILNSDIAAGNDDMGDKWVDYENLLNFTTLLHSIYTLFEMAILGTWSMVMAAAAHIDPISSLLFFYTYRLFMTLIILPILMSFIIQAFISRSNRKDGGGATAGDGPTKTSYLAPATSSLSRHSSRHFCDDVSSSDRDSEGSSSNGGKVELQRIDTTSSTDSHTHERQEENNGVAPVAPGISKQTRRRRSIVDLIRVKEEDQIALNNSSSNPSTPPHMKSGGAGTGKGVAMRPMKRYTIGMSNTSSRMMAFWSAEGTESLTPKASASAVASPAEVSSLKEENGLLKSRIADLENMLSRSKETI